MTHAFVNPLAGYPATVEVDGADGVPSFHIAPQVLTPLCAKVRDNAASVLSLVLWLAILYDMVTTTPLSTTEAITMVVIGIVGPHLLRRVVEWSLLARREIVMTAETIAVRGLFGWQSYSRHLEHRFALFVHDRAQREQRDNDYEVREAAGRGKAVAPAVYYGQSFHVVLVYAGHRVDLLTVFGERDAAAIIARLQYCDRCLDKALTMGRGVPKSPEEDWNDAPGGVNHD